VVGPAGGTASDSQGLVQVVIPPGALAVAVPVQITPFTKRAEVPARLPDITATTYAFELEPDGLQFAAPVTVRVANYRNLPTTLPIPTGYYDRAKGRWVHIGQAVWDGEAFAFQTTHFSPYDCNFASMGVWMAYVDGGADPNNSAQACGAGSSVGYANGALRQSFSLPGVVRQNREWGATLSYDSGLVGMPGNDAGYDAVGHALARIPTTGTVVGGFCSRGGSGSSGGGGGGTSPGTCNTGASCGLGVKSTIAVVQKIGGSETKMSGEISEGYNEIAFESSPPLPMADGDAIAASGFQTQTVEVSIGGTIESGGSVCAGGGGVFGAQVSPNTPPLQVELEDGPTAIFERRVLVHHRLASPYGAGWGIEEVSRLYQDSQSDMAVLVWGNGDHETFRPRVSTAVVATTAS
jgi:hypothetical protein